MSNRTSLSRKCKSDKRTFSQSTLSRFLIIDRYSDELEAVQHRLRRGFAADSDHLSWFIGFR